MQNSTDSLLEFPCEFPIKVIGPTADDFDALVVALVLNHVEKLSEGAVTSRLSRNRKYCSITVTIVAQGQAQLDAIYRELSGHERILMVL